MSHCQHTFHGLCEECKKPVKVEVSGTKIGEEKNLNSLQKVLICGGYEFQVDRLEDTKGLGKKGGYIYHVFMMDGSEHGKSVGGDFISLQEAIHWIKATYRQ